MRTTKKPAICPGCAGEITVCFLELKAVKSTQLAYPTRAHFAPPKPPKSAAELAAPAHRLDELKLINGAIKNDNNTLNAIINMAFKHLDIDKLSPFRALHIRGEAESIRPIPLITSKLIHAVKERMLEDNSPYRLIALIQLNTGMRISEPTLARLDDCVLDHPVPHIWVRKNSLTDRKTQASIRAIPLCGVSLDAAKKLYQHAKQVGSEWLVPQYARDNGNTTCSATMNKCLKDLGFRSHMFRHAFVDRIKVLIHQPN